MEDLSLLAGLVWSVLLAASAQNRWCTALVCSCYVPSSRNFNTRHEGSCNGTGVMETQGQAKRIHSHSHSEQQLTLKSNLKKKTTTTVVEGENQLSTTERRKVTWSDAHGKDIAHVQEFEPSVSEDGELEGGVRNSCVCTIQ